jgi:ElaB/YqjD/DUF883 family membrane-anchored ribosome-binding protein
MAQGDSQQLATRPSGGDLVTVEPRDTDEIRREIEASRRQIAQSLGQLRGEVSATVERALDWRQWVHDHPTTAVGIAFGVGLYFGLRP